MCSHSVARTNAQVRGIGSRMSAGMMQISDNNAASDRASAHSLRWRRPDCCQARASTAIWPNVRKNVKSALSFFWNLCARMCALLRARCQKGGVTPLQTRVTNSSIFAGPLLTNSRDAAVRSLTRNSVPCNIETSSCRCASSSPSSAGSECNERFRPNSRLLLFLSPLRQLSRLADMRRT
jgi:hypothetical protein